MDPLEVNNFSGGVTDYPLQGSPNRAEKLDNFLITQDSKLVVRDGYKKPDTFTSNPFGNQEIDELFTIENKNLLLSTSNGIAKIKDKSLLTSWIGVAGGVPDGGQVSLAEYSGVSYLTSDTDNTPRKIYQNEKGDYVSRRVGLPKALTANTMTDASLLADCIALANEIRSKFINHLEDYNFASYTDQDGASYYGKGATKIHANRDKKTLSYFQTETFGGGDPESAQTDVPAAPAATDSTTLFALVKALKLAFNHHIGDASIGTSQQDPLATAASGSSRSPLYHNYTRNIGTSNYLGDIFYAGPSVFMDSGYDITSVVDAAAELDQIYRTYYLHKNGLHIHSFENNPVFFNLYNITLPQIKAVQSETNFDGTKTVLAKVSPTVAPNLTHFYNFINNLKFIYRKHILQPVEVLNGADWTMHTQKSNNYADTFWSTSYNVDFANCTTLLEAEVLLYHLRAQFWSHNQDSNPWPQNQTGAIAPSGGVGSKFKYWTGTADFTNGANTIADVKDASGAKTLMTGAWLFVGGTVTTEVKSAPVNPYGTSSLPASSNIAKVSSSVAMDRLATTSPTPSIDSAIMATWSKYHGYAVADALVTGTTQANISSASSIIQSPDSTTNTLTGMVTFANELFNALESHTNDSNIHIAGTNGLSAMNVLSNGNLKLANLVYLDNVPNLPFFIPEAGTVNYAFFYSDSYIVDQFQKIEKLTLGSPVYVGPIDVIKRYGLQEKIESKNPLIYKDVQNKLQTPEIITNLPTLSGYDSDIKMNIYRTSLNGSVYFNVDEIANGTASYSDYSLDELPSQGKNPLITRQNIYTTGGVVGFDQIEGAKFVHVVNNKAYYAGIIEDGKLIKNRLLQSINGAPDAVPASFFDDFDDEIVGLSSARSNLIVFCKNSIYRETGEFGETGQGFLSHEKISDVVGGLNQKSIVQTEIGVFFAGTDGFYYTDGYQLIKLSLEIDITYKLFTKKQNQKDAITGSYDSQSRRVWFSVKTNEGDIDNKIFFVLNLNNGVKPSSAFTKVFGDNISHTSHIFWNDTHFVGKRSGHIIHSSPDQKSDVNVDTNYTAAIEFDYLSCALDAGSIFNRKYATKLHVLGDNVGNANIEPYIVRDKNSDNIGIRPMAEITYKDNLTWGQPSLVWGQAETWWNNTGKMDEWRRFPRTTLRSDVFQIGFRNSSVGVFNSESNYFPEFTFATLDAALGQVTVYQDGAGYDLMVWPSDIVGMKIAFDLDDYVTEYEILSQNGAQLTVLGTLPSSVTQVKFVIRGKKKNQRAAINSYVVHFARIGDNVKTYTKGDGGEN